ncbi:hypothetical protein DCO58_11320 [Helicobacter saguini]|uniref:LPS export ABC transporter periplasmic protein LptC n=1 Tax=Helicobacter saguini TaxID=1548018 RepID=A0A347VYP6_9HELI|nr:hypothetical protein [Helicobacter saguini]MWV61119.1 hypothetical protein [Helicobacter saguini]MWV68212.1 hypothetical protein [Helicobacter saguini]MWV70324.1 hypothetical protein [Helicobacter saguini]MWV72226.1 hypothetical protein [Helicobacter saguini]TLD95275.1 hypothetical protein LS64_002660 [Helicobacter saguini]
MASKITYFKTFIKWRNRFFRIYNKIDFILVFFLFLLALTFTSFFGFKSPLSSVSVDRNLASLEISDFRLYRFASFVDSNAENMESKSQDSKNLQIDSKDSQDSIESKSQKDSKNITESNNLSPTNKTDSIESNNLSPTHRPTNKNLIDLYAQGTSIKQFSDKEIYTDFIGQKLDSKGEIERLQGAEVLHINDDYDFTQGINYAKGANIKFFSQFGVYNIRDEIFKGRGDFVIEDEAMKTTGKNIFYDKKSDEITAIDVHSQIMK